MQHRNLSGRGGFTLAEMLVAMALLAVLAAVVLPSVLGQLNKGEVSRVSSDLKSVSQAVKAFYADVQRWPANMTQLTVAVATNSTDLAGAQYGTLSARWKGPYLERMDVTSGFETGFEATISPTFATEAWNSSNFIVVSVTGVAPADGDKIDELVDGSVNRTEGSIRHDGTTTMRYLASPVVAP